MLRRGRGFGGTRDGGADTLSAGLEGWRVCALRVCLSGCVSAGLEQVLVCVCVCCMRLECVSGCDISEMYGKRQIGIHERLPGLGIRGLCLDLWSAAKREAARIPSIAHPSKQSRLALAEDSRLDGGGEEEWQAM